MESFLFFRLIPRVGGGSSGRVIGVPEGVFKCRFVWQITSRYFFSTFDGFLFRFRRRKGLGSGGFPKRRRVVLGLLLINVLFLFVVN